ncbi:MAG: transporter ATP-binding protein [Acidimicrobiaceae bacterium]|jgi:iron(III) transport system ATP-binding protein|nr:transporter ATP-binding protein [Acidimicrobiaceae bacterium]
MMGAPRRSPPAADPSRGHDAHRSPAPLSVAGRAEGDLSVVGLTKRFGSTLALDEVTLAVEAGTFLVLLGPSGSGKTTFLRGLAGIEKLDSGTIHVGGRLVARGPHGLPPEQRDLAMVFQDYALWRNLTVRRNLQYALVRRHLSSAEVARACAEALERVALTALADRYPSQLSGGEQQRVALARALVARPRMLLFDEPLSHLDADLRERLRIEISTTARESGATCIYITHDQREAFALADRIGVLHHGKLLQLGRPEEIHDRPVSPFVAAFSGIAGALRVAVNSAPHQDGRVTFRLAGPGAELSGRWCGDAPPRSDRATAMIRPSAVHIEEPGAGRIAATVLDTAFRGEGYDHVVALADGTSFIGVPSDRRWERNRNVGLVFDPRGCLLYERDLRNDATGGWESDAKAMRTG